MPRKPAKATPPAKQARKSQHAPNWGRGRPPGIPNKVTASVKAAICAAFDELGGVPSLVAWGKDNQSDFYGLWGRLAPREIVAEVTGKDGGPIQVWHFGDRTVTF